ncbi:hypothetical protein ARMGADRAFT_772230 [Armillaria gallica]|uniref:Uncharacterized protein n=1 Tax=Armillaria gallica TaxID=47427 RepID=A0A2H3CIJ5_ARMGA|nr:hypothetical protein ARMGADRAFT_772230 [Armillaria gallica]
MPKLLQLQLVHSGAGTLPPQTRSMYRPVSGQYPVLVGGAFKDVSAIIIIVTRHGTTWAPRMGVSIHPPKCQSKEMSLFLLPPSSNGPSATFFACW